MDEKDKALGEKQQQLVKTEKARADAESKGYRALMGEMQALRFGGQAGWRRHALENLKQPRPTPTLPRRMCLNSRTEAVACLTAPDLRREHSFQVDETLSMAFSPDGGKLVVMSTNGKVVLWDLETLQPLDSIASDYGSNRSKNARSVVQFHPSGRYYVFADLDGVRVVALKETPDILSRLDLPAEVIHLGFNRKGDRLAVFRADQRLSLYEVPSGKLLRTVEIRLWKKGEPFALSPDADFLAVVVELNNVLLYSFDEKGTFQPAGDSTTGA